MKQLLVALIAGMLFGLGLAISEMINPVRVIGFLNVFGGWDLTLVAVMGGALLVTVPFFPLIQRRGKPLLSPAFALPTKTQLDLPLITGAVMFGIGWGIGGLCPGPAIAGLASGKFELLYFIAAMAAGHWIVNVLERRS